eukprot:c14228_g1_i1 orf=114-1169(+)
MASAGLCRTWSNTDPSYHNEGNSLVKQKSSHGGKSARLSVESHSSRGHVGLRRQGLEVAAPCFSGISSSSFSTSAHSVVASDSSVNESVAQPTTSNASKCVLVVGATGGVGQLVLAALLDRGYNARAILRDTKKASAIFGKENMDRMQVFVGDTRNMEKLDAAIFEGVTHVICCTGTTAFPSKRWEGDNTPENTDWHGVRNLIDAVPKTVQRFVLVSSIGVTKFDQLPWNIMNLFGVLKYKKMGEAYLCESGIPFTIIRAGRLTDGPYTSYDLNTLLKATAGTRRRVVIGQGDKLVGEVSRIVVAEACIQALSIDCTCGKIYEVNSVEGDGPGTDQKRWEALFTQAHTSAA